MVGWEALRHLEFCHWDDLFIKAVLKMSLTRGIADQEPAMAHLWAVQGQIEIRPKEGWLCIAKSPHSLSIKIPVKESEVGHILGYEAENLNSSSPWWVQAWPRARVKLSTQCSTNVSHPTPPYPNLPLLFKCSSQPHPHPKADRSESLRVTTGSS